MAKLVLKAPYYKPGHTTEKGQTRGGYTQYIATREGVAELRSGMLEYVGERFGSNGLFTDAGEKINLSKVSNEIDEHKGNVWGFIISLKRSDAERLVQDYPMENERSSTSTQRREKGARKSSQR